MNAQSFFKKETDEICPIINSIETRICRKCSGKIERIVLDEYHTETKLYNEITKIVVKNLSVLRCISCKELYFDNEADDQINEEIEKNKIINVLSIFIH